MQGKTLKSDAGHQENVCMLMINYECMFMYVYVKKIKKIRDWQTQYLIDLIHYIML